MACKEKCGDPCLVNAGYPKSACSVPKKSHLRKIMNSFF